MNFSDNLRALREENNVTQKQLATYLCLSRSTIAGYETKSHQPDFVTLEKLAIYFDVSIDYLVTNEGCRTQKKECNSELHSNY